jgi:hypothetical protein
MQAGPLEDCTTVVEVRLVERLCSALFLNTASCVQTSEWLRLHGVRDKVVVACAIKEAVGYDLLQVADERALAAKFVRVA